MLVFFLGTINGYPFKIFIIKFSKNGKFVSTIHFLFKAPSWNRKVSLYRKMFNSKAFQ